MNALRAHNGADAYRSIRTAGSVEDASPHQLIDMLLSGAIERISQARGALQQGDVARKGSAIGQAISIVEELRASLDHERGGELTANLEALYDYLQRRLLEANLRNDDAALAETAGLLGTVLEGWRAIPQQLAAEGDA